MVRCSHSVGRVRVSECAACLCLCVRTRLALSSRLLAWLGYINRRKECAHRIGPRTLHDCADRRQRGAPEIVVAARAHAYTQKHVCACVRVWSLAGWRVNGNMHNTHSIHTRTHTLTYMIAIYDLHLRSMNGHIYINLHRMLNNKHHEANNQINNTSAVCVCHTEAGRSVTHTHTHTCTTYRGAYHANRHRPRTRYGSANRMWDITHGATPPIIATTTTRNHPRNWCR